MAKVTKQIVDKELRNQVFQCLFEDCNPADYGFDKINDRQYGVILTDANGEQRYIRIGAIVAELREDMTAEELMAAEKEEYRMKQEAKAEKAKEKEKKIADDKAKREAKAKAEAEKDDDNQFLPSEITY